MALCRVPGCGAQATRFGQYCTTHKSRIRRHGDVAQLGITKAALAPYVERVRGRIAKNADSPLWRQCDERWSATQEHAQRIIAAFENGRAANRFELRAAGEVVRLAEVEAREVVETVAALYLMRDAEPRKFRSDAAFNAQLVRRVRGLSEVNVGAWFDYANGRTKRVYRDVPPRRGRHLREMAGRDARRCWLALGRTGTTGAGGRRRQARCLPPCAGGFDVKLSSIEAVRKAAVQAKGADAGPFVVKLEDIRRDPAFQIRSALDNANISKLIGAYKAGAAVPPIIVAFCGDDHEPVVIDGHHRCEARRRMRAETVEARAVAVSRLEARWRAAKVNDTHGLSLKPKERREMFRTYVSTRQHIATVAGYGKDGQALAGQFKSYAEIAQDLAMPKPTVWRWMKRDHPKTAAKMAGNEEFAAEGGTRPVSQEPGGGMKAVLSACGKLRQVFGDATWEERDGMLKAMRSMVEMLEEQHRADDGLSAPEETESLISEGAF